MNLGLFNNLLNNIKKNENVQNFINELSNSLEREKNVKQEDCIYQVVEMDTDGVYLQNINNNNVSKEQDISKDLLNKIGNDSVLRYKGGEYIYEEELTEKFLDSLVDIKEYKDIQDKFVKETNILEIDKDVKFKLESKEEYCILSYGSEEKNTIKVPNELIPFWAKVGDKLYYKNGKFNREL